ncbi:hypothetical protein HK407_06g11490 [Ordospora pajunii]|uniref:uncharacterized protein n=1 Tax=Ordospora pajunii TaxID=3039483 RepID=UPI00295265E3|nr:uncharacterized protein HK407_06g11490 [Ordospora pajunii]KAH9411318.1 hypothetical protein HK407_06g11490 [Ordospora pajunii]
MESKLYPLVNAYLNDEMHYSALALSEYIYARDKSDFALIMLLRSLCAMSCYERCIEMIELNDTLMRCSDVKIIYYKCRYATRKKNTECGLVGKGIVESEIDGTECGEIYESVENALMMYSTEHILKKSVRLLFEGLTKEDVRRKEILLEAYRHDNYNMEALIRMKNEGIVDKKELVSLVEDCKDVFMREVYMAVFYPCFEPDLYSLAFYSPWYGLKEARRYYKSGKDTLLFSLGTCMVKKYPGSEFSFISLGLFFLMAQNYQEARRCFYKAVQINNEYGRGWMYLGMAYSGMKECESSISCLKVAYKKMIGSYKPSLYLAIEYHRMNNFERASVFYKQALKINPVIQAQERYIALLIYYEYYAEALEYLNSQSNSILDLLRVYCNLFLGKVNEAQKHLLACKPDWKYYATAGFIDHLTNRLESAASNYNKALLKNHISLIEELLGLAIENIACKQNNNVYDYASDLFDCITPKCSFEIV